MAVSGDFIIRDSLGRVSASSSDFGMVVIHTQDLLNLVVDQPVNFDFSNRGLSYIVPILIAGNVPRGALAIEGWTATPSDGNTAITSSLTFSVVHRQNAGQRAAFGTINSAGARPSCSLFVFGG